jgi:hypothetical protein
LWHPADVGVDDSGNVYVTDQDNSAVRKINTAGIIATLAGNGTSGFSGDGGPATAALLNFPQGIAVDSAGNVFVADYFNSRVRKITAGTGIITTVAGNGTPTFGGDYGPATAASFAYATALATDRVGNLYITDYYSYKIRKVYTNGIIATVAGIGTNGYSGDYGPATAAQMSLTQGLAVNDIGHVFIADFGNAVVRIVTNIPDSVTAKVDTTLFSENASAIAANSVKIFPDPSAGRFTIQTTGIQSYYLKIYNSTGMIVYEDKCDDQAKEIDISELPPGIYLMLFLDGKTAMVKKTIVKSR